MNIEAILNSAALGLVCLSAMLHLGRIHGRAVDALELVGFAMTAGGAFGTACAYWWPWAGADSVESLFHIGLAAIAASLLGGYCRALMARLPGLHWTERRTRI